MKLKATDHSYYCSATNYYVGNHSGKNFGRSEYDSWADFKEDWEGSDEDYNHVFRFDINESMNPDTDEPTGRYEMWLFFMLQRKGIYRPVWIKDITEEDMPEIDAYLKDKWEYLKNQWAEFSNQIGEI